MFLRFSLLSLFSFVVLTFTLFGCSFRGDAPVVDELYLNGNGVQVDLMKGDSVQYDPRATSLGAITQRTSDGSVEIYSIDGSVHDTVYGRANAVSPIMQPSEVVQDTTEEPFTPESGLEIFPLDKKMNQALRLPK